MKTRIDMIKKIIGATGLALVVAVPIMSEAKNEKAFGADFNANTAVSIKSNDENRGVKFKKCVKAFGHLIASGWIRGNGEVSLSENCRLPWGIMKKVRDGNGNGGDPDTTAPVLQSVSVIPGTTRAVVRWSTDERSDSVVWYATSTPVNVSSSSTLSVKKTLSVRDHRIVITGLAADTTYFIRVGSKDAAGNIGYSGEISFKTLSNNVSLPVISNLVAVVGTSTVEVKWNTDEPSTSKLYYKEGGSISTSESGVSVKEDSSLTSNHSVRVDNLKDNTLYSFLAESKNASGGITTYSRIEVRTVDAE